MRTLPTVDSQITSPKDIRFYWAEAGLGLSTSSLDQHQRTIPGSFIIHFWKRRKKVLRMHARICSFLSQRCAATRKKPGKVDTPRESSCPLITATREIELGYHRHMVDRHTSIYIMSTLTYIYIYISPGSTCTCMYAYVFVSLLLFARGDVCVCPSWTCLAQVFFSSPGLHSCCCLLTVIKSYID